MYNKENYYFVWLSSINIKPVTKVKLLEQFKTPKIIFESTKEEFEKNLDCEKLKINIKNKELLIEKIIDKKVKENVTKNIEKMNQLGIGIITYLDEEYPQNLKDIYDFPICLYFIGNKKILQNNKKIANVVYTFTLSIFLYIKLEYMPVIPANGIYIKISSTIFFLFVTKYSIDEIKQSKIIALHPVRIIVDKNINIIT